MIFGKDRSCTKMAAAAGKAPHRSRREGKALSPKKAVKGFGKAKNLL
jgi:hypothetical protein